MLILIDRRLRNSIKIVEFAQKSHDLMRFAIT